MANPNELLARLMDAFPRQVIEAPTADLYEREIAALPEDAATLAVATLIRTSEFFPTVARIRETAAEHALGLPTEAAALAQIDARIAWAREDGPDDERPPVDPVVTAALHAVGGYPAFRTTDAPGVLRGQFGRIYRELRAEAVRGAQVDARALVAGTQRQALTAAT